MAKCRNQGANCGTADIERFDQTIEASSVKLVPLCRDFCGNAPNQIDVHLFSACECRLERIPTLDVLIYRVPRVHSPERRVGKAPLARIEAIALIDENCFIAEARRFLREYHLPAVCIARPFVQYQDTSKVPEVRHLPQ